MTDLKRLIEELLVQANERTATLLSIIAALIVVILFTALKPNKAPKPPQVNLSIKKESEKVVDKVPCGEIESIAEFKDGKLVMCRCWRSKNFPYCDGAHVAHVSKYLVSL